MGSSVKKELLQLLKEDEDVQKLIRDMIRKEIGRATALSGKEDKPQWEADSLPSPSEEEIKEMIREWKDLIDKVRGKNRELKESIQSARAGEANAREELRSMRLRAESMISDLRERNEALAQEAEQQEEAVKTLQGNIQSLRKELDIQKKKNLELENEVEEKEEALQSRFAAGYACFMAYQGLDEDCREKLSSIIRHEEDFESFICCLSQSKALENIWDAMWDCVMEGRQYSVEILDTIFNYSMDLINKTLSQPYYERLSVQEGTLYDSDLERLVPNSPNQGLVQAVYLEGFRNRYSPRIIRKSLVSL